ncbi:MAG: tetratricopeptide repeat protein [Deltaproteobacteria bacterium]|nr:tetratricopeptide repeat protein [Deltaproteobacteria bacterium]
MNNRSNLLIRFSEFIASVLGLHFPESRLGDLERGVVSAAREFDFPDTEAFIRWIMSAHLTKRHIETLASHLTIGETYFFREMESFQALEERILPGLLSSREGSGRRLRVWSAGCSTGEEPYSLAILLNRLLPDRDRWNITILATDINPRFLGKAKEGLYTEWSFRGTPQWIKEGYFKRSPDGRYELDEHIRKMVAFEYLNLAEDNYPCLLNNTNAMDLIFCRNVLMYFSQERARKVIQGLHKSLVDGGYLFISATEALKSISSGQFVTINMPGATYYIKDTEKPQKTEEHGGLPPDIPPLAVVPEAGVAPFYNMPDAGPAAFDAPSSQEAGRPDTQEPAADREYEDLIAVFEQGGYDEAIRRLERMVVEGRGAPKITSLLARAYANQGRLEQAQKWCEKAIAEDLLNPYFHYLLSTILQEQGQVEQAASSLKRALYINHDFVLAYFSLGNLMLREGNSDASMKYLRNALELLTSYDPEQALPYAEGMTAGRLSEIIASMSR